MINIVDLLNRIRWDREFGRGTFEIGHYDHVARGIVRIPFQAMRFDEGNHFSFLVEDRAGETRMIPFHRVREVYKDGELIWRRPP